MLISSMQFMPLRHSTLDQLYYCHMTPMNAWSLRDPYTIRLATHAPQHRHEGFMYHCEHGFQIWYELVGEMIFV